MIPGQGIRLTAGRPPHPPCPVIVVSKPGFHLLRRTPPAGSEVDDLAPVLHTDVLPPDLTMHASFPAEPAFRPEPLDQDVHFRHSGWQHDRRRVYDALRAVFPRSTRVERFRLCGANAWVVRRVPNPSETALGTDREEEAYAVVADHCHDRFCRPCSQFRSRTIAGNIASYIRNRRFRFLTITIKTSRLTLKQGVNKLYRCFAKLRRTKLWRSRVTGGCCTCEVKPSTGQSDWHPHLHCIIEGKFLPLKPLRKLWLQITGDSYIIDISLGKDADDAARYISKYITKPFDSQVIRDNDRLEDAIHALHGRRLVSTFGHWRGQRLTVHRPHGEWVKVSSLSAMREAAYQGEPLALQLLTFLHQTQPYCENPRPKGHDPPSAPPAPTVTDTTYERVGRYRSFTQSWVWGDGTQPWPER